MRMSKTSVISPELVQMVKRSRFNPIRTLTPAVLSSQLDSFAAGYLRDFAISAEAIKRRDDVISVALTKREKAVSRRDLAYNLLDGLPPAKKARADEHAAALRFFYENVTVSHALDRDVRGGYKLLVRQMMSAEGAHYAVHEIVWEPRVDGNKDRLTATLNFVPLQFFEATIDMAENEWLVTVGGGILEPLSVAWMFKQLSLKDWVAYNELAGTPFRLGETSAAKGSPEWQVLVEALEDMGAEFSAVVNTGSKISFVGAPNQASIPFPALVERMDRAMATICRGADLSTMSAGSGEGSGASLQGDEGDLLEQDDAEMISETLQRLDRIIINQLFGEEPLAYVQVVVPERKDNADLRANVTLAVGNGVAVGQSWLRDQLGLPAPVAGEPILVAPVAPAFPTPLRGANADGNTRAALFNNEAIRALTAAQRKGLQPFIKRGVALFDTKTDAEWTAGLKQLRADLPDIGKEILAADPTGELVKAWESILGPALVSGAAEAAQRQAK
jgi:phage gp29-like protein